MEQENKIQKVSSTNLTLATLNTLPVLQAIAKNELASFQADLTADVAIQGVSMSVVRKVDQEMFNRVLATLLTNLHECTSVNQKFGLSAMPFIIKNLTKKYYFYTLEEVAYIFKKGISGDYPKPYNKLDLETIMGWFDLYDSTERMDWIDKKNHNEKIEAIKNIEATTKVFKDDGKINQIIDSITGADKERQKEDEYQKFKQSLMQQGKIINNKNINE